MFDIDIDYFRAIQNATGMNSSQDIKIAEAKRDFDDGFDSSTGLKRGLKISNRTQDFIVTATKKDNVCKIFSKTEKSFNVGELLRFENNYWLITSKGVENGVYLHGEIEKCNYLLRWQNLKTYEIVERWCVVEAPAVYSESGGSTVTLGDGKLLVSLPYDEETRLLGENRRFLIEWGGELPHAYKFVWLNGVTETSRNNDYGVLSLTMVKDELQVDDDRIDLGIADYVEPPANDNDGSQSVKILFSGKPELRVGGNSKTFSALFLDDSGSVSIPLTPVWEVLADSNIKDWVEIVLNEDGSAELKFVGRDEAIGKSFELKVSADSVEHGYFESKIKIDLIGLF